MACFAVSRINVVSPCTYESFSSFLTRLYPPERNANEEVLPSIDPEPELPVGPNRKRGRTDSEQAGPSKSRRV